MDCKPVGSGAKALIYLRRYLYRGVIAQKDMVSCKDGQVTLRYRDSKTNKHVARPKCGKSQRNEAPSADARRRTIQPSHAAQAATLKQAPQPLSAQKLSA